jgi:hypothetical protein
MSETVQSALNDAHAELRGSAGISFAFGSVTFTAWPVRYAEHQPGSILASGTQKTWFETKSAPFFQKGNELIGTDPNTGGVSAYTVQGPKPDESFYWVV